MYMYFFQEKLCLALFFQLSHGVLTLWYFLNIKNFLESKAIPKSHDFFPKTTLIQTALYMDYFWLCLLMLERFGDVHSALSKWQLAIYVVNVNQLILKQRNVALHINFCST